MALHPSPRAWKSQMRPRWTAPSPKRLMEPYVAQESQESNARPECHAFVAYSLPRMCLSRDLINCLRQCGGCPVEGQQEAAPRERSWRGRPLFGYLPLLDAGKEGQMMGCGRECMRPQRGPTVYRRMTCQNRNPLSKIQPGLQHGGRSPSFLIICQRSADFVPDVKRL